MALFDSLQAVFDKVWDHFVVQKQPQSMCADGQLCMYRGNGGAKCILGVCIPDELYDEEMESKAAELLKHTFPREWEMVFDGISEHDLARLQGVHDSAVPMGFVDTMTLGLTRFADKYNLTIPTTERSE